MSVIFDAFQTRFKADQQLLKRCRRLYEGVDGERLEVLPHVMLVVRRRAPIDAFSCDIEEVEIELQCWSRDFRTDNVDLMLWHLHRVFDDARIDTSEAHMDLVRTSTIGPVYDDGRYRATIEYTAYVTYHDKSPLVRAH